MTTRKNDQKSTWTLHFAMPQEGPTYVLFEPVAEIRAHGLEEAFAIAAKADWTHPDVKLLDSEQPSPLRRAGPGDVMVDDRDVALAREPSKWSVIGPVRDVDYDREVSRGLAH